MNSKFRRIIDAAVERPNQLEHALLNNHGVLRLRSSTQGVASTMWEGSRVESLEREISVTRELPVKYSRTHIPLLERTL